MGVPFGFEWAIQTILSDYILRCPEALEIETLEMGEKHSSGLKHDLRFRLRSYAGVITVEIKTLAGNCFSTANGDVAKPSFVGEKRFLLLVAYTTSAPSSPRLRHTRVISETVIALFRFYLLEVELSQQEREPSPTPYGSPVGES